MGEKKPSFNNGGKPLIAVCAGNDEPNRGDVHGLVGLANSLAEMTDTDFVYLDDKVLQSSHSYIQCDDQTDTRISRLRQYFKDSGQPDFLLLSPSPVRKSEIGSILSLSGSSRSVITYALNENLPGILNIERGKGVELVPHHLTAGVLEQEGKVFAKTFPALPRPLIGINLIDDFDSAACGRKIARLCSGFNKAAFFILSCPRTGDREYDGFINALRNNLPSARRPHFIIEEFNYNRRAKNHGFGAFWNPYAGLIHQADHLILCGESSSIRSEARMSGKEVHFAKDGRPIRIPGFKNVFCYDDHEVLVSASSDLVNITPACAEALMKLRLGLNKGASFQHLVV